MRARDIVRWCDDARLAEENVAEVAPGGYLNPFSWYVVGPTIGGNAVVVSDHDPRVRFADHTWYGAGQIEYQDLAGDRSWKTLPYTSEGVAASLFPLAASADDFAARGGDRPVARRRRLGSRSCGRSATPTRGPLTRWAADEVGR